MCGRAYETYTEEELEMRYLNRKKVEIPDFKTNFNMCPTQLSPVVRMIDGIKRIDMFRFGLVPSWAKTIKDAEKYSLINAKSEDIETKRTYKIPFEKRRCIVPLSGFFEWKREEKGPKRPFAIQMKDEKIMSVAGVWEHWESADKKEVVNSFAIITTGPNDLMLDVHDRMPVILSKENEEEWLDPENHEIDQLKRLLKPCPPEWLSTYEVSTLVNSPKNNTSDILIPLAK